MAFKRMRRYRKRAPRRRRRTARRTRKRSYHTGTRAVFRKFLDIEFSTTDVSYQYFSNTPKGTPGWSYYASAYHNFRVTGIAVRYVPKATNAPMEDGQKHYDSSIFMARDFSPLVWTETGNNLIYKIMSIPNHKQRCLTRPFTLYFPMNRSTPAVYMQTSGGYGTTEDAKNTQLIHIVTEKMAFKNPGRFYFTYYCRFKNRRYTSVPI